MSIKRRTSDHIDWFFIGTVKKVRALRLELLSRPAEFTITGCLLLPARPRSELYLPIDDRLGQLVVLERSRVLRDRPRVRLCARHRSLLVALPRRAQLPCPRLHAHLGVVPRPSCVHRRDYDGRRGGVRRRRPDGGDGELNASSRGAWRWKTDLLQVGHSRREGGCPFGQFEDWQRTVVALIVGCG